MKLIAKKWSGALLNTAFAVFALLPLFPIDALAQGFVTGSAHTDGFSVVGLVHDQGHGRGTGFFTIIVHRDVVDGVAAAAVCDYKHFDNIVINGNTATFHSKGSCEILTASGTLEPFDSDNTFGIVDNGEPGTGNDSIDVNFLGASGVAIPGSLLGQGNFIVSP